MTKLEKVIKGLENHNGIICAYEKEPHCPYFGEGDCIMKLCRDALELLKSRKWISVKDRLPDSRKWVLCRCRAEIYEVMRFNFNNDLSWYHDDGHEYLLGFVTHWMPLPEPPKED